MIRTKKEIDRIISNNYADFVAVSKPFINNPYWLFKIAKNNGINLEIAKQYSRCFQPWRDKVNIVNFIDWTGKIFSLTIYLIKILFNPILIYFKT